MKDRGYKTLVGTSEGFYKEKGSKFISYAYRVQNTAEVKEKVAQLKKQYHDARHHCFAFVLEENGQQITRANDDGEPNHSAGDPILGQIKSFGLENVLVVVVRYFGGTKLGVSGLIQAYKTAAEHALAEATTTAVVVRQQIHITYPYDKTNEVMRLVSEFDIQITEQVFEGACLISGGILPSRFAQLKAKLAIIQGVELQKVG
ncbi:MAG: YigZ family protein [Cyclobacteriaceae bacterium]